MKDYGAMWVLTQEEGYDGAAEAPTEEKAPAQEMVRREVKRQCRREWM